VLYYFCLRFEDVWYPLAMVELFSEPDADILFKSSGTVHLCDPRDCVVVLPITSIHLVVAMFPDTHIELCRDISLTGKFSLMQHPYMEVAHFTSDSSFKDKEEDIDSESIDS
jgi:hypothetical protein